MLTAHCNPPLSLQAGDEQVDRARCVCVTVSSCWAEWAAEVAVSFKLSTSKLCIRQLRFTHWDVQVHCRWGGEGRGGRGEREWSVLDRYSQGETGFSCLSGRDRLNMLQSGSLLAWCQRRALGHGEGFFAVPCRLPVLPSSLIILADGNLNSKRSKYKTRGRLLGFLNRKSPTPSGQNLYFRSMEYELVAASSGVSFFPCCFPLKECIAVLK